MDIKTKYAVGVDVGGSHVCSAVVDVESGEICSVPLITPIDSRAGAYDIIAALRTNVLIYCLNSNRTTTNGLLRSEGESMDQSIFKAVFVPYAVNFVLDEKADKSTALAIKEKLLQNAEALSKNLDRTYYPSMYCNYYWGSPVNAGATVSMGAQASGASLIENVARMVAGE